MRVLLVDDHPAYLRGLAAICAEEPWIEVVGQVSDGRAAVEVANRLDPDVVVMDLHLPDLNGVEATRQITGDCPRTAVLVLTMHDDDASLQAAVAAGARGYLLKESAGEEIVRAIGALHDGGVVFGSSLASRVLGQLAARPAAAPQGMTARDVDVLRLLSSGASNRLIAQKLSLSEKTVRNYVSRLLLRIGASDREAAGAWARQAGLTAAAPPVWGTAGRDKEPTD